MSNLRQIIKRGPTLRMANGGEVSPYSLKGMYRNAVEGASNLMEKAAPIGPRPQPQVQPAPAAPPPTLRETAPMGSQSMMQSREAAAMKAAGLREGGEVAGHGKGDKVPTLLEPDEFVVSNDMLDAAPGLRENLHSLRANVLAEKGMTPEQADAKAVHGATLRAQSGGQYKYDALGNVVGAQDGQTQEVLAGTRTDNTGVGGNPVVSRDSTGGGGDRGLRPGVVGGLRTAFPNTAAVWDGATDDISRNWKRGRMGAVVGDVARGALGGIAAVDVDLFNKAKPAFSGAANTAEDTGRALFGMADRPEPTAPTLRTQPTFSPNDQSAAETARLSRQASAPPAFGPAAEPSPFGSFQKASLRDYSTVDQNEEARRVAQGRAVFEQDKALGDKMEADRLRQQPTFATVGDGGGYGLLSKEYQDKRTAGMNQNSAIDELVRKGMSVRGAAALVSQQGIQQDANKTHLRTAQIGADAQRYGHDVNRQGNELNANVSLRNNELTNATAMAGHNMSMAGNRAKLMYDMSKDQRDYAAGRSDKAFEQREAHAKDTRAKLESMFTTKDSDGKTIVDKDAVASHEAGITAHIGNLIAAAEKRGDSKTADELRQKGAAAMGEDGLQKLVAQLEVKRRSQSAHSALNPFGGNHVDSANPSDYDITGIKRGLTQDQYVTRNGSQIPTRALDYSKGGGSVMPNDLVDTPTQRFQIIKQPKLREF